MAEISLQGKINGDYRRLAKQNGILFGMLAAHVFWNRFVTFVERCEAVFVPNDRACSGLKMATMPIITTISEVKSLDLTGESSGFDGKPDRNTSCYFLRVIEIVAV